MVASLYQCFNAINITEHDNKYEETYLLLLETNKKFSSSINLEYLKTVFANVWIIRFKEYESKIRKSLYLLKETFGTKVYGTSIVHYDFDEVFISGTEMHSKIVAYKLMGKNTKLYYYEDGIASYYSVLNPTEKSRNDIILKYRYGSMPLDICKCLYVYEPNCVQNNIKNIKLVSIPKLKRRKFRKIDLKKVYLAPPFDFSKKIVFLKAWFENAEKSRLQDDLIEIMVKHLGNDNCYIKTHPNEMKVGKNIPGLNYINTKSNFEISNYFYNFDECIFISIVSTASFSPKLIYGQEPKIVYLYKIFQNKFRLWPQIDYTIAGMSQIYKDTNKIYIPNSLEQYAETLDEIKRGKS